MPTAVSNNDACSGEERDQSSRAHANRLLSTRGNLAPSIFSNRLPRQWGWWLALVLVLLQYGLLRQHALREVTWSFPPAFDQALYLARTYRIHEVILDRGLLDGIGYALFEPTPNGVMLPLQGALLSLVLGPERLTLLTVNFLYYFMLQISVLATLRWLSRGWSLPLVGLGLLLTALSPFYCAGGLMDFRIDFVAFCLFGMLLCLAVRCQAFLQLRWSAAFGALAALLVLFRFITAVYLAGILGAFFLVILWKWWRGANETGRDAARRRLCGILIASGILWLSAGPALWRQREHLRNYYVVGHLTGPEKELRAAEFGVHTLADRLLYYPRSLWLDHLGLTLGTLGAAVLLAAAALEASRRLRRTAFTITTASAPDFLWPLAFVAIAVVMLFAILAANISKSPVVGSIIVPGMLWLVLLPLAAAARRAEERFGTWLMRALALSAVLAGLLVQVTHLCRRSVMTQHRADCERLLALYDRLEEHIPEASRKAPVLFVDCTSDQLNYIVTEVMIYERHGKHKPLQPAMGGLFAKTDEEVWNALKASDFVILGSHDVAAPFVYPFDRALCALRPALEAYCETNLDKLGAYQILGREVLLYARPTLRVHGALGGWVTPAGLRLTGHGKNLRACRRIELCGPAPWAKLGTAPNVAAELHLPGQPVQALPALVTAGSSRYRLLVEWQEQALADDTPVCIHLSFDVRPLGPQRGMRAPERVSLLRE